MAEFYFAEPGQWETKQSTEVDWRTRLVTRLALEASIDYVPLRFRANDGYDIEVTPDTAGVMYNLVDDNIDYYWVRDHRDGTMWVYFRGENREQFEEAQNLLQNYGLIEQRPLPSGETEHVYLNRMQADLSVTDEIPSDWEQSGK